MAAESVSGIAGTARRRTRSPEAALYALFVLVIGCALVLLVLPRAIAPTELPTLRLPAAAVAEVMRDDARRASAAPRSAPALELVQRFQEFGASEIAGIEDARLGIQRRRVLHHLYERVVAADGASAALMLREQALGQLEAALDLRLPKPQVNGVMGVFANVLSEHRATRNGEEVAPHFVLRTLYKARWNRMLDLAADFGFAPVERVAYFGWLGIHADNLPLSARRQALLKYAAAGGPHASEAQGVLAFLDHDYTQSIVALERAYAEAPSLRLRNYLRGARVAAGASDGSTAEGLDPNAGVARVPSAQGAP
jgi:hypothetical protein